MNHQNTVPSTESPSHSIVRDFLASLVVFMVAVPLCIAIAEASGLPPEAGIVSGIIGGTIVGLLSGSPLSVSGPAAGLIVVAYDMIQNLGIELFGLAVVLAGLVQIIAAALRLGVWFRAVSPAVVSGMLAGIGIVIIAKQFHVMFDLKAPERVIDALAAIPASIATAAADGQLTGPMAAGMIGLISLGIMIFWKGLAPRRLKVVPAAVVAVVAATLVAQFSGWQVTTIELEGLAGWWGHYGPGGEKSPTNSFTNLAAWTNPAVWSAVVVLSLIASAETLLCCTAVDSRHTGPRTQYNRELLSQGIGNMACGLVAALPITAVIVRSSANIDAGARSRRSTILHGIWLFLFVAAFPGLLRMIPLAALAGVLVYTGWRLLELREVGRYWKECKGEVLVYVVTAAAIVLTDLLTGVIIGVALAALRLLLLCVHLEIRTYIDPKKARVDMHLEGSGTFLNIPQLAAALDEVPRAGDLHIHVDQLLVVDHAVLQTLMNYQKQYEATGGRMYIDWAHARARFQSPGNGNQGRRLDNEHTMPSFLANGSPSSSRVGVNRST
jgi:MFS superfamily sulfate permease-like transporter